MPRLPRILPGLPLLLTTSLVAQGSASVTNGVLSIDAGPGSVQVKVTVDPNGDCQVFDVPGLPSPIDFRGVRALDYRSGVGSDELQLEVATRNSFPASIFNPEGSTQLDLVYQVLPTATPVELTTVVVTGPGEDLIQYSVDSRTSRLRTALLGNTGEGRTDCFATVNSPDPSQTLDTLFGLITGAAQDQFVLEVVSAASRPSVQVGALSGDGADTLYLNVDQSAAALPLVGLFGDLGAGNDLLDVRLNGSLATYGHYGELSGGAGLDGMQMLVDTDLISIGTLAGGDDRDQIDLFITGGLDGVPTLSGGFGDDDLVLDVAGRRAGTPTLDGGPGFDFGSGYGNFVSIEARG